LILIGAGSGIAPYRGFWQELQQEWEEDKALRRKVSLFFGCRKKETILYKKEMEELEDQMGYSIRIAFSREFGIPKVSGHPNTASLIDLIIHIFPSYV